MVMSEEWKDLVANGVEGIVDSRMVTRRRGEKHQRRNPEKGGMGEINIYKKGKSHGVTLALFLHSEGSPRREKKKNTVIFDKQVLFDWPIRFNRHRSGRGACTFRFKYHNSEAIYIGSVSSVVYTIVEVLLRVGPDEDRSRAEQYIVYMYVYVWIT